MPTPLTIGLMSGTSLDGIDVAICHIAGHAQQARIELLGFDTVPYPRMFAPSSSTSMRMPPTPSPVSAA
ncbi:MAG: anhydro-N-acetylmuramic acid kinase [Thermomicrobiales bacterium]|nr:anhydro-N-acetylmuramic acid kinase [Thermomicrobiales bacterium]